MRQGLVSILPTTSSIPQHRIVLSVAALSTLLVTGLAVVGAAPASAGYGADPSARFDAGLVNPDGTPREAFSIFAKNARKHR